MSLPLIVLSVTPAVATFFVSGNIKSILLFVSWINLWISSSDIINSLPSTYIHHFNDYLIQIIMKS